MSANVSCLRLASCLRLSALRLSGKTLQPACTVTCTSALYSSNRTVHADVRLCKSIAQQVSFCPFGIAHSHRRRVLITAISNHGWTGTNATVRNLTVCRAVSAAQNQTKNDHEQQAKQNVQKETTTTVDENPKKQTVVQKLKKMFKDYWYVLLPVHISTSAIWIGSCYYLAKSGIDIVPLLEYFGTSEIILKPLRNTGVGYWAVTYALYKLVTPLRYMVTLGGTTLAINYLKRFGLIRPMPSSDQMKAMFHEKRQQLKSRRAEKALAKRKDNDNSSNADGVHKKSD